VTIAGGVPSVGIDMERLFVPASQCATVRLSKIKEPFRSRVVASSIQMVWLACAPCVGECG
jgi:hypothetical protein